MKNKKFDCVALKHKIQEKIYHETRKFNSRELLEYLKKSVAKGPFGHLVSSGRKKTA
ncbi:MAG: hypothetical protein WCG27_09315 [Pseudomonadota bacterium]